MEHFDVLLSVLRFTTKRSFYNCHNESERDQLKKYQNKDKPPPSESNLLPEMIKAAESTIKYDNPKKLFKNSEFTGKGGFGSVYYAKGVVEKTRVAVKKMPHVTEKEKRMNIDEISVLHHCNNPNIVKYYRSYIWENEIQVVMEFLEGGNLSEAVKKFRFDEQHIAYVGRDILKGIQYLHANNLVHRDLKSSNVMMSISAEIKLIDFGLTVDITRCVRPHMVGSPFWMPPEMIRSEPHGFPSDIWSFAVSLMEMADSEPPNRKSRIKSMFVVGSEGLIPFVQHHEKYSDLFKDFLVMCLQFDPTKRATPRELLTHPFIGKSSNQKTLQIILREIFLANAFEGSGLLG